MNKVVKLFFQGRSNRKQFWIMAILCFILGIAILLGNTLSAGYFMDTPSVTSHSVTVTDLKSGEVKFQETSSAENEDISGSSIASYAVHTLISFFGVFVIIIPMIKRLHDLGKSGWLSAVIVIPLLGILFWFLLMIYCGFFPGQKEDNKYGPIPA